MAIQKPTFILASASPRRLQLLQQAGIAPDEVAAPSINETPRKGEVPASYVQRMAREKALAIAQKYSGTVVLAADTVVACGRRILPKAEDEAAARKCLQLLSGRRHRVYTAVALFHAGKIREQLVMTQVKFDRLLPADIDAYLATGEWHGKAGGYAIQGVAERFIPWISGSYSNVVGLPLSQTCHMLAQVGVYAKKMQG